MVRLKRFLHALIAITVIATIYILTQEKRSVELEAFKQEIGWQERAPRSLSNDYESNAIEVLKSTATPSPTTATVRDLFISIKTTVHYHQARLPIILKTWFQLAPEQIFVVKHEIGASCFRIRWDSNPLRKR
ncbi:unnamed protein product [Nezara viridula]|uniref:Fringe-like glycosyltransferase domain-containing protein n=1 Tax=Nezara viridula TaxID=85310 RepID=A0A9P0MTZ1_NEZVI|nr:unnamed protein product [Nezara viridula]